jgi:hypothetical protein
MVNRESTGAKPASRRGSGLDRPGGGRYHGRELSRAAGRLGRREPFVSCLLADHGCDIWYPQASRGPTSYTTFDTRRGLLTPRPDELRRMVQAICQT